MDLLASGYAFLEAPRYDGNGGLYFVDDASVWHLGAGGEVVAVDQDRPAGGVLIHRNGGVVVSGESVVHLTPDGTRRELLSLPDVEWINDIYADRKGRVYCGSIPSGANDETTAPPPGHLWRIESAGQATQLYDDVGFSNGIGFSPDGTLLYHSDTVRRELIVHRVVDDELTERTRVSTSEVPGAPDGLAVDEAGLIWVAMYGGGCIARFASDGSVEQVVELPAVNVTSVAFGGSANEDLFVVTCDHTTSPELAGCIYRMDAPVPGLPTPEAAIE